MNNPNGTTSSQQALFTRVLVNCRLPKANENPDNCQDSISHSITRQRIAISDGATQSFDSGSWAHQLCEEYCHSEYEVTSSDFEDWLATAQSKWHAAVAEKSQRLKLNNKPSWIEYNNSLASRKPASATFVGITFKNGYMRGLCIGDSYAFIVEVTAGSDGIDHNDFLEHKLVRVIPSLWKHTFSNRTQGFLSYPSDTRRLPEFFELPFSQSSTTYVVFLATDALAEYLLSNELNDTSILPRLLSIDSEGEFENAVKEFRLAGMANDDTSLLSVIINQASSFYSIKSVESDALPEENHDTLLTAPEEVYETPLLGSYQPPDADQNAETQHECHSLALPGHDTALCHGIDKTKVVYPLDPSLLCNEPMSGDSSNSETDDLEPALLTSESPQDLQSTDFSSIDEKRQHPLKFFKWRKSSDSPNE